MEEDVDDTGGGMTPQLLDVDPTAAASAPGAGSTPQDEASAPGAGSTPQDEAPTPGAGSTPQEEAPAGSTPQEEAPAPSGGLTPQDEAPAPSGGLTPQGEAPAPSGGPPSPPAPPRPAAREVRIYSCGFSNLGSVTGWTTKKLSGFASRARNDRKWQPSEHEFTIAVGEAMDERRSGQGTVLMCNCLPFHDPASFTDHNGFDIQVIRGVFDKWSHQLDLWFRQIWDEIYSYEVGPVHIFCYCRAGKHRSVATSWLLHCALLLNGLDVKVEHICRHWWGYTNCQRELRREAQRTRTPRRACPVCSSVDTAEHKK